jgi:hypothetical protein
MMDQKLTISDIEYIYNLAEHKTDEELAAIIKKPVSLIQMQFALMTGLPLRPWQKALNTAQATLTSLVPAVNQKAQVKKKETLKPLKVGRKKRKTPAKRKAASKKKVAKEKPAKKPHNAQAEAIERRNNRRGRNNQSIYATKPLDLPGKVRVKLNAKTEVWVAPGTDIAALKKKLNIV